MTLKALVPLTRYETSGSFPPAHLLALPASPKDQDAICDYLFFQDAGSLATKQVMCRVPGPASERVSLGVLNRVWGCNSVGRLLVKPG